MRHVSDLLRDSRFLESELASELYVDEVLAGDGSLLHIDSKGSVSALVGLGRTGPKRVLEPYPVRPTGDPHGS